MIFDLLNDGLSFDLIINLGVRVFFILFLLPIHEFAHAWVSYKLGDQTARLRGRLTLNPLAHIDPIGSLMMLFAGFGYAKAVPVNMNNFPARKRKKYMAIVAFAGPLSNIILAFIFLLIYSGIVAGTNIYEGTTAYNLALITRVIAQLNIGLAVFNLLPVPPLDGSRILSVAIPDKYYYTIMQYERYIVLAVFALIMIGVLDVPLNFLSEILTELLMRLAGLPFGI